MSAVSVVDPRRVASNWLWVAISVGLSVPWSVFALAHWSAPPTAVAIMAGLGVLGAAFLLSWAVETAELDVPPALAVSVLALVAVLPEYAVDATFAWKAAYDPMQGHYAIANMTGGNRLLLGVGWALLVLLAALRFGRPGIRLPKSHGADISVLLAASFYALVPVARGQLTLVDTVAFGALYLVYVVAGMRGTGSHEHEEGPDELVGPAALFGAYRPAIRRPLLLVVLCWSAGVIYLAADPFAQSLVETGKSMGIDEFLLVQWVAPIASESPEFAVAALLVLRGRLAKGLLTLVSSKVNQWTLLVGTLPVITSLSGGRPLPLALDARQREELFLTAAQSLFGVATLSNGLLSRIQALVLFVLFAAQMFVPTTMGRWFFAMAYLICTVVVFVSHKPSRSGMLMAFRTLSRAVRGHPA